MSAEQMKRIVEVVKSNPGIQMDDLDAKVGGMILGIGDIPGITEEEFDSQFVGAGKPLKKVNCGYYIA